MVDGYAYQVFDEIPESHFVLPCYYVKTRCLLCTCEFFHIGERVEKVGVTSTVANWF